MNSRSNTFNRPGDDEAVLAIPQELLDPVHRIDQQGQSGGGRFERHQRKYFVRRREDKRIAGPEIRARVALHAHERDALANTELIDHSLVVSDQISSSPYDD